MAKLGSVIDGKYKILHKLGQGGMSVVYLALNERANKQWAIKEIRKDVLSEYELVRQSLVMETEMLKQLKHPYLPSIIDVIENENTLLIVMDYIEGIPLSQVLRESGIPPQDKVVKWAIQLCEVLEYLHEQNPPIVYRDMKPANVMLRPDGNITVIDFGAARTFKKNHPTDTKCLGTQGYAAPEQYGGHGQTDARTDIYGLGITLYHLLTGHNPCYPPYEIYPIRRWDDLLSSGLEAIIIKCTQKNPNDRYQSCLELKYTLEHYHELDSKYLIRQKRKRNTFFITLILTGMAALAAVGFNRKEYRIRKNNYEQYLINAKSTSNKEEQYQLYCNAINLNPMEETAYLDLIEICFLNDNLFSLEEDEMLRKILSIQTKKKYTNESCLKTKRAAYEAVAYRAAMAYYYYFEDQGNKAGALKWLEVVKSAATLELNKIERGKRLAKIAEYYHDIDIQNIEGDPAITYYDYWQDMIALTKGNLVLTDNMKTALVMYQELISQICRNSDKFKHAGVKKEDVLFQIENVTLHLQTDIVIENETNRQMLQEEILKLKKNIEIAQKMVEAVYK